MKRTDTFALAVGIGVLAASAVFAADPPAAGASATAAASPGASAVSGSGDLGKSDCRQADLAIEGASTASAAAHRVGQTLRIVATGGCIKGIKEQLAKNSAKPALTLVLDDVEMKGVRPARPLVGTNGALIVPFELSRDSLEDENRKSWDALLFKQHEGYTMKMSVALMMGTDPAVLVADRDTFSLEASDPWRIGIALVVSLLAFVVSFVLLVRHTNALRDSRDGPFSLGRSQMAFWGLLVLFSFLGVFIVTVTMERIPKEVLILLGISGTTGISAVLIGAGKKSLSEQQAELVAAKAAGSLSAADTATLDRLNDQIAAADIAATQAKQLQQSSAMPMTRKFFTDICDDGNGLSFHRIQVVFWTIALGGVFIWSVAKTMSMPSFQDTLLVLMGISNGTYLGFKFPERT